MNTVAKVIVWYLLHHQANKVCLWVMFVIQQKHLDAFSGNHEYLQHII